MKFRTVTALSLLSLLSFIGLGKSCDYGKTLSCCGTHINFIINSYQTNNLFVSINPAKRARVICCHMKHVEKCLFVESNCRPFYNTFVYNLYNNLQQHDVNCAYYKQHFCPGLQPARQTDVTVNIFGKRPKAERPLVKYPEEATIVVNAIADTVKTALENATQERPTSRPTTIYADTVTEPGLVLDNFLTTPIPELSFGENTLIDCDYDGTTPMPDVEIDEIGANFVTEAPTDSSVDAPVLEVPTKCHKSRIPVSAQKPQTPKPVSKPVSVKPNCANDNVDDKIKDSQPNEVINTFEEKAPKTGGCGKKDKESSSSNEVVLTKPASNEENPSEPKSTTTPVESGEAHPEGKVTTDAGSSEQNPGAEESGEQSPGKTKSGEQNLADMNSGEKSPANTDSGEQSPTNKDSGEQNTTTVEKAPGNDESGEKAPRNEESGEKTPGNDESGEKAPGNDESGEKTPGNDESGEKAPGIDESGGKAPGKDESGTNAPVNDESGEKTPGNDGSGEKTPAIDESGEKAPGNGESGETGLMNEKSGKKVPGNEDSGEQTPNNTESGKQTQPAKKSGEESPSTACSSSAKTPHDSEEEVREVAENNEPQTGTKEIGKPCKEVKQPGPSENINVKPAVSEKQISPEEKQLACCLGTYLKPCTTVTSKCYQLYLALHSFLAKYECLSCVNMEVVHDGCHQREVLSTSKPKLEPDSSEEETRQIAIPIPLLRPAVQLPKAYLPQLPQYPIKAQRGKHVTIHHQPIRKPPRKAESSEEKDD